MYKLVFDDPILKQELEPFDFQNPPIDPVELAQNMKEAQIEFNGLGLSACQVGLPYRMFTMGDPGREETIFPVFNPKIVDASTEDILLEEGCLSFPYLYLKIKRPKDVRVRYANEIGEVTTQKMTGTTARIFLHEFDHMNGIVFTERANRFHLEQGRRKRAKMRRRK